MTRTAFFIAPAAAVFLCLFPFLHAGEEEAGGPDPEAPPLTADDIPLPIVRTQVGDWASYVTAEGGTLRLTVVERWNEHGDDHLIIESAVANAKKRGKRARPRVSEQQVSLKDRAADQRDLGPEDSVHASTVLVKGRTIDCAVVNYREDGELRRQSYFSDQVPVYGLVRGVLIEGNTRTVSLRLEDFGFAGEGGDE